MLTRSPGYTGGGPIRVALAVLDGEITWTTSCTLVVIGEVAVLALLTTAVIVAWRWSRRRRTPRVDPAARRMATRAASPRVPGRLGHRR